MLTGAIIEKHTEHPTKQEGEKGIYKGLCRSSNLTPPFFFFIEKDTESDISASQIVCQWLGGGYNPISWFSSIYAIS